MSGEPFDLISAAKRLSPGTFPVITVFNDEEANVIMDGLRDTGVKYDLKILYSLRTEDQVETFRMGRP